MTEAEKEAGPMTATYINPKLPSVIRNLYRADPREWSVRNVLNLAADLVQELIDLRAEQGAWEYAGVPIDEAGREWKERPISECKELVTEHADPGHWINSESAEDVPRVVAFELIRRRKAGPWEPVIPKEEQ